MCGTPHSSRTTFTGCCKPGTFSEPSISASDRCASSLTSFGGAGGGVWADEPLQDIVRSDSATAPRNALTTEGRPDISPSFVRLEDRAMSGMLLQFLLALDLRL